MLSCGLGVKGLRNEVCFVVESLAEHNLDLLCITETWLLPSDVTVVSAALPSSYSFHHVPRSTDAGGGGGGGGGGKSLICSRALSNVRVVPNHMDVSSFEFLEITFSFHLPNIRMLILYRPGHPGTDCAFMEEFDQFLEILSVCREKLVICGDFNYWLDNPSLKPYTNEFMSLLDINNMSNYVQMSTHISGHILDLPVVLTPVGVRLVNQVEVSPTDTGFPIMHLSLLSLCDRTCHLFQENNFPKLSRIERARDGLLSSVAEGQTSVQPVDSYNRGFTSLRD